jgi:3D (Asp-Asp-Asp) domain-containing protein
VIVVFSLLPVKLEAATRFLTLKVTAYCAGPCKVCGTIGITATGRNARKYRGIAVASKKRRRAVPIGRKVFIPGQGWFKVDDTGRLKSNQLDLRFNSHKRAKKWGVKILKVKVKR